MLPLQRLYSHGLPPAGATRNGRSIPRRSNTAMRRAVREFTGIARNADIAVVYYAGHGIEFEDSPN